MLDDRPIACKVDAGTAQLVDLAKRVRHASTYKCIETLGEVRQPAQVLSFCGISRTVSPLPAPYPDMVVSASAEMLMPPIPYTSTIFTLWRRSRVADR